MNNKENKGPFAEGESKKKTPKLSMGRKVAYSAVGSALSVVMIVISCYLPFTILPLILISLCFNIIYQRCGFSFGIISTAVTVGLGFLFCIGHLGIMIIVGLIFVPYSIICYFLRKVDYSTIKGGALRGLILSVFISLSFLAIFFLANAIIEFIDISKIMDNFAIESLGYVIINLVLIIGMLIIDFIYLEACRIILPKLK